MKTHDMTIESYSYAKQYGMSRHTRLVCTCGLATQFGAGSSEVDAEAHRRAVIEEALGLKFTIEHKHLGER